VHWCAVIAPGSRSWPLRSDGDVAHVGAGNGGVAKKFRRSDQVNALSRLTDFQSIAAGPKAKKPPWFAFRRSSWSANFSWVWSPTPGFSATTLRTSPYATAA
jgi:hypothetical protein